MCVVVKMTHIEDDMLFVFVYIELSLILLRKTL